MGAPTPSLPDAGVQIYDRTSILHVMVKKGQVTGVETDKGQIECQYFVNCAGQVGGGSQSGSDLCSSQKPGLLLDWSCGGLFLPAPGATPAGGARKRLGIDISIGLSMVFLFIP